MKSTGIVRRLDELGRIALPSEIRRTHDLGHRDEVEIYVDGDRIVLQKYEQHCCLCGGSSGLRPFHGKQVCRHCREDAGHLLGRQLL